MGMGNVNGHVMYLSMHCVNWNKVFLIALYGNSTDYPKLNFLNFVSKL